MWRELLWGDQGEGGLSQASQIYHQFEKQKKIQTKNTDAARSGQILEATKDLDRFPDGEIWFPDVARSGRSGSIRWEEKKKKKKKKNQTTKNNRKKVKRKKNQQKNI